MMRAGFWGLLAMALTVVGAATDAAPGPRSQPHAPPLTAADSGAWLDRTLPPLLRKNGVAGAVVVIVKDGRVLAKRGYGYADVAAKAPVDPDRTLFRPGSISKLFTWTAVMQQVERGRIDLDADINLYLDFAIPPMPGARAITMRDLMTHRAGFEDGEKSLIRPGHLPVRPLGVLLRERLPERVAPPGVAPAYSNYGTALAGYIVERVSGVDFVTYVRRNILDPLGMRHSTFAQPVPVALRGDIAQGYADRDTPAKPFETIDLAPAGGLSASGADMAKFMIAFLAPADPARTRLLGPAARAAMLTTRTANGAGFPANLLGFYEAPGSPRRIAKHEGDTNFFHSDLSLFIDDDVGFFLSLNSSGTGDDVRTDMFRVFSQRYFPGEIVPPGIARLSDATARQQAEAMAGEYRGIRRSSNNPTELGRLLMQTRIIAGRDGTLESKTLLDVRPDIWHPVGPFLWRHAKGDDYLVAQRVNGRVTGFTTRSAAPFDRSEWVPAWQGATVMLPLILGASALLVAGGLLWPMAALASHLRGRRAAAAPHWRLLQRASAGSAIVMVAWICTLIALSAEILPADDTVNPWILTLRQGGGLLLVLSCAACWYSVIAGRRERGLVARIVAPVLAIAASVALYAGVMFGLIGFDTLY